MRATLSAELIFGRDTVVSLTSNVWKIFAHTTAVIGTQTHAHTQVISDAWDTFGITESFGCELIILGPFPARQQGNLPVDVGGVPTCALPLMMPLMPQRHCCTMNRRLGELMRMDMAF